MRTQLYWLSKTEWKTVAPLLPCGCRAALEWMIERVSAGSFTRCVPALAGGIARLSMGRTRSLQSVQPLEPPRLTMFEAVTGNCHRRWKVSPMCPVRSVTYVSGRSSRT